MKTKIIILSIIAATSTLYSENNTSYIPALSRSPAPPGDVRSAPVLPSNQHDLAKIERLEQRIKQLEQHNEQQKKELVQRDLELKDAQDWMNEYRAQLFIPMLVGWLYHTQQGWIYADTESFPYIYRDADRTWLYFSRDHEPARDWRGFYNYTTNEWEIWE